MAEVLPRAFYARPTLDVAGDLIGKRLVHVTTSGRTSGLIVEVEAYIGESDPACHAAAGLTPRNAPLYGRPGRAYVYLNYGIHYLVNAVTEPEGAPAAVLLRAVEPVEGIELMRRRRQSAYGAASGASLSVQSLCRGPGNLTRAFGVSTVHNRLDLCGARLFIEESGEEPEVEWTSRVGLRVGIDLRWRCAALESACVSGR